jgi:hypothetical protein
VFFNDERERLAETFPRDEVEETYAVDLLVALPLTLCGRGRGGALLRPTKVGRESERGQPRTGSLPRSSLYQRLTAGAQVLAGGDQHVLQHAGLGGPVGPG